MTTFLLGLSWLAPAGTDVQAVSLQLEEVASGFSYPLLVTHAGEVVHPRVRDALGLETPKAPEGT